MKYFFLISALFFRLSGFMRFAWFVNLTCILGLLSYAQAGVGIDQLHQFGQSTKAASGEFVQTIVRKDGRPGKSSEGTFSFARPGKFSWHIRKPFEQLVIADGQKLYLYDIDLAQVSVRPLGDILGATPAALLFGPQNLDTLFNLKEELSTDGLYWVLAVPKNPDNTFQRIRIAFQESWPVQMELLDALGQTTKLNFRDWRGPESVILSNFKFSPPPGVDVLDASTYTPRNTVKP